jgi:hypothetical protein
MTFGSSSSSVYSCNFAASAPTYDSFSLCDSIAPACGSDCDEDLLCEAEDTAEVMDFAPDMNIPQTRRSRQRLAQSMVSPLRTHRDYAAAKAEVESKFPALTQDLFSRLAGLREDGGMEAPDAFLRLVRTVLVALVAHAHDWNPNRGIDAGQMYALHIHRMVQFLKGLPSKDKTTEAVITLLEGNKPIGDVAKLEEMLEQMFGNPAPAEVLMTWNAFETLILMA